MIATLPLELPPTSPVENGADLSECGTYRWRLWRRNLLRGLPPLYTGPVCWIMLNPSTADHAVDDPTIRRCIAFTLRWGHADMEVVNVYPFRSPSPERLAEWAGNRYHPAGRIEFDRAMSMNRQAVLSAARGASKVIVAFGNSYPCGAPTEIEIMLRAHGIAMFHLGLTKDRNPKHPLARGHHRIPDDQEPMEWP